jgi:hypothetical protein
MSKTTVPAKSAQLFSYSRWSSTLPLLADRYRQNCPVSHLFLPEFLPPEVAAAAARELPAVDTATWTHWHTTMRTSTG